MKVLITGGAGFIGSHLTEALLARGDEAFILDNLSTSSFQNIHHLASRPTFHYTIDSIHNESQVDHLVQAADVIYHLAAAVGVQLIMDEPIKTLETNVLGTSVILKAAARHRKKILIASSSEVYGKSNQRFFNENDDCLIGPPNKRRWVYAVSKTIDEFLAMAYWSEKELPVVVVRLFNTIGPRQIGKYGMVVPRFIEQALKGEPLVIHGNGKQTRCFISVLDAVKAMMSLMDISSSCGEIVNIGSQEEISIEDLAKSIIRLTGSRSELVYIPHEQVYGASFEDMHRRMPDTSKLQKMTGFRSQMKLDEILNRMIANAKSRHIKEPNAAT